MYDVPVFSEFSPVPPKKRSALAKVVEAIDPYSAAVRECLSILKPDTIDVINPRSLAASAS